MKAKEYLENHWIKNKIWTHLEWPKHQNRLRMCTSYLEGEKFIDVGCGLGHSTYHMKKFLSGNWSGMEFWKGAVVQAKKLFPEIKFYYSEDFNFLPVCGKHDGVVCSEVLEHVEEDRELIEGLLSITKDTLVITTPSHAVNDPGHVRLYNEAMLADLFRGTQFNIHRDKPFFYIIVKQKREHSDGK